MNPHVETAIDAIAKDRAHGADWLARQALAVMERVARGAAVNTCPSFIAEMRETGSRLVAARPSMAPVQNLVGELFWRVIREARDSIDAMALKSFTVGQARRLSVTAENDALLAAEQAADIVSQSDSVLTGSYSATVAAALRKAFKKRKALGAGDGAGLRILVARSEFGGKAYGPLLVEELGTAGAAALVIADKDITRYAREASLAITGADSILPDGSVVNGCPTLAIAKSIVLAGVPFYVVAASAKVSGSAEVPLEPGFDLVPGGLVSGVITERGLLDTAAVARLAAKWKRLGEALKA
jgi:translation initiation factor eIF-2B subunit delta